MPRISYTDTTIFVFDRRRRRRRRTRARARAANSIHYRPSYEEDCQGMAHVIEFGIELAPLSLQFLLQLH